MKKSKKVIHLKMRSVDFSGFVKIFSYKLYFNAFEYISPHFSVFNRLLLEIQLGLFPWSGIGMRNILVMISRGRRLKRRKEKINCNPFLLALMIPKIGGFQFLRRYASIEVLIFSYKFNGRLLVILCNLVFSMAKNIYYTVFYVTCYICNFSGANFWMNTMMRK